MDNSLPISKKPYNTELISTESIKQAFMEKFNGSLTGI